MVNDLWATTYAKMQRAHTIIACVREVSSLKFRKYKLIKNGTLFHSDHGHDYIHKLYQNIDNKPIPKNCFGICNFSYLRKACII